MNKRVCIIGGGPSGLTAIKSCLEEGLNPVCYEKTDNFGGLWRYRNEDYHGVPSVMKSTVINSSKELSAFSDFPPRAEFANFMHNTNVVEYLEDYIKEFNLAPYIVYNHVVNRVDYADDYDESGKWKIIVEEKGSETKEEMFDYVMVCVGHHVYPNIPDFPGLDEFKGIKIHTHSYKVPSNFQDKTVVVVGIGNSGGDVAVELSRISKKVYLSTRRGTWVMNRVGVNGYPLDATLLSRFNFHLKRHVPWNIVDRVIEVMLNSRFDHELYGLKPKHHVFQQHIMVNDDMPNRIASGTLVIKGDIHKFSSNAVTFEGEENIEYFVDCVILATGYNIEFPFLPDTVVTVKKNKTSLYKNVFPPSLKHPTLAIIGLIQPLGSILPISEMQCRWATRVFKNECQLPDVKEMLKDIEGAKNYLANKFVKSQRHTIQVDYIDYVDDIAKLIGAKPNLFKYFFSNPILFKTLYFGPCYPYQYRLTGPHSWDGAKKAIFTGKSRIENPLKTRQSKELTSAKSFFLIRLFIAVCFFGHFLVTLFQLYIC